MTAGLTTLVYIGLALAAIALEIVARRRHGAGAGDVLSAALRFPPARWILLGACLWWGWHAFVRVDWR